MRSALESPFRVISSAHVHIRTLQNVDTQREVYAKMDIWSYGCQNHDFGRFFCNGEFP